MTALAIGGHILGTIAGIAGANLGAKAAKYEARVASTNFLNEAEAHKFNAKVADQMAENTRDVARAEAMDFRRAGSGKLATRRAQSAASGVTGQSPLMVEEKILSNVEFGAARIVNAGDIISTRQKNEAQLLRFHAKQAKDNARYARVAGRMSASAAKLGGYTSIAQGAIGIGNTISSSYG
jgi:hypothetical protein